MPARLPACLPARPACGGSGEALGFTRAAAGFHSIGELPLPTAIGFNSHIKSLLHCVHYSLLQLCLQVVTKLAPASNGQPTASLYGLEGFNRLAIMTFLSHCATRADQAASKPAEQPAPFPIVVPYAFFQCQVRHDAVV